MVFQAGMPWMGRESVMAASAETAVAQMAVLASVPQPVAGPEGPRNASASRMSQTAVAAARAAVTQNRHAQAMSRGAWSGRKASAAGSTR